MTLWLNTDAAASAPKNNIAGGYGVAANGYTLFGNNQVSAYVTGMTVGDFGVDAAETAVARSTNEKIAHAGWVLRKAHSGPVSSITLNTGNVGYNVNGYITFTASNGTGANASYTVNTTTNTITTITLVNGGSGYTVTPTATAANATGVNSATFTIKMGGRANRVQTETLVAMGSMTGDASDDVIYPDA